jgi:hypothetical protein
LEIGLIVREIHRLEIGLIVRRREGVFSVASTTFTGATPGAVVVGGFRTSMMMGFGFYRHWVLYVGIIKKRFILLKL